ncbi:MAG: UDP-N-acetylmuramoyl-L-alanine--D-glutamate ligase [Pirellulales bacterium]|nr:UDP-N-acetylmuramoyl-L-alanine--D-glutamate ligase [Pirellulales bacterium]
MDQSQDEMEVRGKRVTVMGLGRHGGGVAVARYLAERGAIVTVTDRAAAAALRESFEALSGVPLADVFVGGHRERDFRSAEIVVVNPAVRPDHPLVLLAADSGAVLTSEIVLFADACPGKIVGVTGSNGKSTTAAMTAAILQADSRRTWLGGNIGGSLLGELPAITTDDWVVLELSSFQLARWPDEARFPEVAVVTNCTPNHLDWHESLADYVRAKQRLLHGQGRGSLAVLNDTCPQVATWHMHVRGRQLDLVGEAELPTLAVPGRHNRQNARLAATAALGIGCGRDAIERGLREYRGLPHRLELVAEVAGLRFYNDSQATTPESAIAALRAFEAPVWLLAGGYDKGCELAPLAQEIARRARGAALYGAVRSKLHALIVEERPQGEFTSRETLAEGFAWCVERAQPGEAIVLSPACASFDQFRDYADRAACFQRLVRAFAECHTATATR